MTTVTQEAGRTNFGPTEEATFGYLNGVGNHERKLALSALVLSEPETVHGATDLMRGMNGRQKRGNNWNISTQGVVGYLEQSFDAVGAVIVHRDDDEKSTRTYHANPDQIETRLALNGFLAAWSLQHPEVSVQQAYGTTNSVAELRAPLTRHHLFGVLIEADEPMTQVGIARELDWLGYAKRTGIDHHVNTLADKGIIDRTSVRGKELTLSRDDTVPENTPGNMGNVTVLIRKYAESLEPGSEVTIDALIDNLLIADPNLDPAVVRRQIVRSVNSAGGLGGFGRSDSWAAGEERALTDVKLNESSQSAIAELYEGIEALKTGDLHHARHVDFVRELVKPANSAQFAQLVSKGYAFSEGRKSRMQQEKLKGDILALAGELGQLTVREAHALLSERHNYTMTRESLRSVFNRLIASGEIESKISARDPRTKLAVAHYTLAT